MNRIKTLIVFMMLLASPNLLLAVNEDPNREWLSHHWQPTFTDYNMTATFAIRIDDVPQTSATLELGAFAGEVCRASWHLVLPDEPLNTGVYITEGYNIQGVENEIITFRLYDHNTASELNVKTAYTLPFVANQHIGSAEHPQYIDFYTPSSSDYILITDMSQLVAGRKYLITSGLDGTVKAVGGHQGVDAVRSAVEIGCANKKTHQIAAVVPLDESVFQFTLGSNDDQWSLYDKANSAYLGTDINGHMQLSESLKAWSVVVRPDGKAQVKATVSDQDLYLQYDSENTSFYCKEGEGYVYLFAQCELVKGEMASLSITDPAEMQVVESGNTLAVTDLSTVHVSNLIIEDGAQLLNASAGVMATMQQEVIGYADVNVSDGWYTLATPMVASSVESGSNLLFPEYDLYAFDETNLTHDEWRNYKNNANNGFTAFQAGRGYLYANGTTVTSVFKGVLNHGDVTFPMTYTEDRPDVLKGFNLVGNPYPHVIYKGTGGAIDDSHLASGYYVLDNSGAWLAKTYETAIQPGQGFLVQTDEARDLSITKTNAAATGETSSGSGKRNAVPKISLHLSNGVMSDVAYLYMDQGRDLNKVDHFNADNPVLSVISNGKDLAIAHLDDSAASVDLRFDNKLAGTFTLTVDVQHWAGDYLYLVDRITGAEIDLLRNPKYTFRATGHEHAFRFELLLKEENGSEEDFAFYDGDEWRIATDYAGATLQVVDLLGRVMKSEEAKSSFSTAGMAPGVYVFRLINGDAIRSQKVVLE